MQILTFNAAGVINMQYKMTIIVFFRWIFSTEQSGAHAEIAQSSSQATCCCCSTKRFVALQSSFFGNGYMLVHTYKIVIDVIVKEWALWVPSPQWSSSRLAHRAGAYPVSVAWGSLMYKYTPWTWCQYTLGHQGKRLDFCLSFNLACIKVPAHLKRVKL